MTRNTEIARAVQRTLAMSAAAAAAAVTLPAQAQTPTPALAAGDQDTEGVATVTVTGSRIRRVDLETASPVYTIDHTAIQNSGVSTVGELVMQLPSVAGSAMNPSTNNGGGFGESYIELRGLDASRTVILLDGRRIGLIGDPGTGVAAVDVNQIPLAIIDHVEILKEGAGAIYGSDAIAGVVNFITRKDVSGVEIYADYGRNTADDGQHHQVNVSFGQTTDKFSFLVTGRYEQQAEVLAGRRSFSSFSTYLYNGSVQHGGSSRTPTGAIHLPTGGPLATSFGCDTVTKLPSNEGGSLADYRCFKSPGDDFNFAPLNLLTTPQERGSLFSKVNYKINDEVEIYSSVLYNRTRSGFQLAPLPFDPSMDNIVISKSSVYNPFGINFGGNNGAFTNATYRLLGLGDRASDSQSNSAEATLGVKGKIGNTGWDWDLFSMYGRLDQTALINGYFFANALSQALGPSFIGAGGVATCGTPAAPISGCTPINIFAVNDPTSSTPAEEAAFRAIGTGYNTDHVYITRNVALDLNGKVWSLPAGDVLASVGAEYRYQEAVNTQDQIVQAQPPLFATCEISEETCTGDSRAAYNNKDIYAELFVPILKNMPGVYSLNVDGGVRFSDYSLFGNTTKAQFKVEYRPVADLLVRGTFSQVFRAPTINDISEAPAASATTFTDPCIGLTAADVAKTPNLAKACVGVPQNGTFVQANSQIEGLLLANPNLHPETGEVTTAGIVYDPTWLQGFSTTVDFWHYKINDEITQLDPSFSIAQCIASGSPLYCNLVTRFPASSAQPGTIFQFQQPFENAGTLITDGVDLGFNYTLRQSPFGTFRFSVDTTHVNSYTNDPGGVGSETIQYAGIYSKQFGNDAKWRGLASIAWDYRGFDALFTTQWIGKLSIPRADAGAIAQAENNGAGYTLPIPNIYYVNLSVGYTFLATNTKLLAGIDNAFNRQPPFFYAENVTNANTDVATYDLIGRRFFVGILQKF